MYVKQITYEDTKKLILNVHYARRMPSISYAFGLFDDSENIVGCVTFGSPASPTLCRGVAGEKHIRDVLELNRLVISPDFTQKNSASFLVGNALKLLPCGKYIVSYADDEGWGHIGYIYQATNFLYTGKTKSRTDKFSSSGHSRHYLENETKRQYRTAKHRYIYITGNKKTRKELLKDLKYEIVKKYPKGETTHYDTENPIPLKSKDI